MVKNSKRNYFSERNTYILFNGDWMELMEIPFYEWGDLHFKIHKLPIGIIINI